MSKRLILVVLICFAWARLATAALDDPDIESHDLSVEVGRLLLDGQFDELDRMADAFRTGKSRFSDGRWKLSAFYAGMHPTREDDSPKAWKGYRQQLERWLRKSGTSSPTPSVALANYYVGAAWKARGTDYAGTVTPDGWRLFHENHVLAETTLRNYSGPGKNCPHWYNVMQDIALGEGWDEEAYERVFEAAVAKEPSYYFYHFSKANFYQSRWYGNKEKLKRFVDDSVRRSYQAEGYTLYARIYWSAAREFGRELFRPGNVDWNKMKAGFEFMNERYPNSIWNLNAFAHFACLAGDKPATAEALRKIGGKINLGAWSSHDEMLRCKQWAL